MCLVCMCVYMCEKFLECVLVCAGLSISCVSMVCMFVCMRTLCVHTNLCESDPVLCMVMVHSTRNFLNLYTCEPVATYVCK